MNIIRIVREPGFTLELRTADPLPAEGYHFAAVMAEAGEGLAALLAQEQNPQPCDL